MYLFKKKGIGFSVHYETSLPEMTFYKKKYNTPKIKFESSKKYGERVLSLPVYPKLTNKNIDYICRVVNKSLS